MVRGSEEEETTVPAVLMQLQRKEGSIPVASNAAPYLQQHATVKRLHAGATAALH
jgi:hypothetical protein